MVEFYEGHPGNLEGLARHPDRLTMDNPGELLREGTGVLCDAACLSPEYDQNNPPKSLEDLNGIFPAPGNVRSDDIGWPDVGEDELREFGARFGMGTSEDTCISKDDLAICEGGKPWKVLAELKVAIQAAGSIVLCGDPGRIIGNDEMDYLVALELLQQGQERLSEYDMVGLLAKAYTTHSNETAVDGFRYVLDTSGDTNRVSLLDIPVEDGQSSCQMVLVSGAEDLAVPIYTLRLDRFPLGEEKKFYRPDTGEVVRLFDKWLRNNNDTDTGVSVVTSNTYPAAAMRSSLYALESGTSRLISYGMYGRDTLHAMFSSMPDTIRNSIPKQTPSNQIPGELHQICEAMIRLRDLTQNY